MFQAIRERLRPGLQKLPERQAPASERPEAAE
jgi:hypothetical protein